MSNMYHMSRREAGERRAGTPGAYRVQNLEEGPRGAPRYSRPRGREVGCHASACAELQAADGDRALHMALQLARLSIPFVFSSCFP